MPPKPELAIQASDANQRPRVLWQKLAANLDHVEIRKIFKAAESDYPLRFHDRTSPPPMPDLIKTRVARDRLFGHGPTRGAMAHR